MQSKSGRPSLVMLPSQRESWLQRYLRFLRGDSPVVEAVSPQPAAKSKTESRSLQVVPSANPDPANPEPLSLQLWREGRKVERIFAQNRIQRVAPQQNPPLPWGS